MIEANSLADAESAALQLAFTVSEVHHGALHVLQAVAGPDIDIEVDDDGNITDDGISGFLHHMQFLWSDREALIGRLEVPGLADAVAETHEDIVTFAGQHGHSYAAIMVTMALNYHENIGGQLSRHGFNYFRRARGGDSQLPEVLLRDHLYEIADRIVKVFDYFDYQEVEQRINKEFRRVRQVENGQVNGSVDFIAIWKSRGGYLTDQEQAVYDTVKAHTGAIPIEASEIARILELKFCIDKSMLKAVETAVATLKRLSLLQAGRGKRGSVIHPQDSPGDAPPRQSA